ncbi:MAG: BMP family ABC transporter substrate-binding protein [Anaerolineae bacterium]
MKTQLLATLLVFFMTTGCQPTATATPVPKAGTSFRVAILLPRAVDADGWTRSGYHGLLLIGEKLGADVAYSENVAEADFEKEFRRYAASGYDFIIGHGNQFVPAAEKIAAEFPQTAFAVSGKYGGNNTNLGGLSLREGEMGYLFGVIAAVKTKTKHVGYIGGIDNSSQQEITTLYKRGIQATDPAVQVTVDFVGSFTDSEKTRQLAQAQIDAGVDVVFLLAGAAGTGVHMQAQQAGIYTLGWIEDLNYLAPKAVLTSNVQDVPLMLLRGATLAKQGRWEGKQYKFGLAEGVQALAPFYGLVTPEEELRINAVTNDLLSGKIDTIP